MPQQITIPHERQSGRTISAEHCFLRRSGESELGLAAFEFLSQILTYPHEQPALEFGSANAL